jgi:hypothetical protein
MTAAEYLAIMEGRTILPDETLEEVAVTARPLPVWPLAVVGLLVLAQIMRKH